MGGGPAGLYLAILLKAHRRDHDVVVLERDDADATDGWGVVFWDDLLADLRASDPDTARAIVDEAFPWRGQRVDVTGRRPVTVRGGGYSIGRRRLLDILSRRATRLGVRIEHGCEVDPAGPLPDADLVVAGDGAGSRLRGAHRNVFGPKVTPGRNKYVWLGTTKVFDTFRFAFVETPAGWLWFHAYGYGDGLSTCVVECPPETWRGLGLDTLPGPASRALLEDVLRDHLDGHPLLVRGRDGADLPWLNFRTVTNRRWHDGRTVLLGDAAHTTHFSIGSGTRLALQDAIALASSLHRHDDLRPALVEYERARRAAIAQPQRDARNSERWLENVPGWLDALDDARFAALLQRRRSPTLARIPPAHYARLHRVAERAPAARTLWRIAAAPWRQHRQVRRTAG